MHPKRSSVLGPFPHHTFMNLFDQGTVLIALGLSNKLLASFQMRHLIKSNYRAPPVKSFFLLPVRKVGDKSYVSGPEYFGSGYFSVHTLPGKFISREKWNKLKLKI